MNQRLQQFLAAENISQAQLADNIEVARASVSHVLAGRNKPGYDFIRSLADHYPKLSLDWLISGKGKMYKQDAAPAPPFRAATPAPEPLASPAPAPAPAPVPQTEDDLFSGELFGPEKADNPPSVPKPEPINASTAEIKTLAKDIQIAANKRSISKILVLYDDNSFQEII